MAGIEKSIADGVRRGGGRRDGAGCAAAVGSAPGDGSAAAISAAASPPSRPPRRLFDFLNKLGGSTAAAGNALPQLANFWTSIIFPPGNASRS